ncbi:MAG: hypothetical protein LUG60_04580 [Erysipelotrichaceae bacterium]|nr:hypothetical protein [Erysipelotrichaceae bacterium]
MKRDILRPSVLMVCVFMFSTFIAILNIINWNIDYLPKTIMIISIGLICAIVADYIGYYRFKNYNSKPQKINLLIIEKWKIFLIIIFELFVLLLYYLEIRRLAILDGYVSGGNLL